MKFYRQNEDKDSIPVPAIVYDLALNLLFLKDSSNVTRLTKLEIIKVVKLTWEASYPNLVGSLLIKTKEFIEHLAIFHNVSFSSSYRSSDNGD